MINSNAKINQKKKIIEHFHEGDSILDSHGKMVWNHTKPEDSSMSLNIDAKRKPRLS